MLGDGYGLVGPGAGALLRQVLRQASHGVTKGFGELLRLLGEAGFDVLEVLLV